MAVPQVLVRVTKNVPLCKTVRVGPVEPVFHAPNPPVFPVSVTVPGEQKVVGPLAEITADVGGLLMDNNPEFDVAVWVLGEPVTTHWKRYPFMPEVALSMVRVDVVLPE